MTPLKDHPLRPIDPSIACIGAGYWGKNPVRNFHAIGALSAVCETSPERCAGLAAAYPDARWTDSIEEALADPRVAGVAIATPAETHGDLVRRALLAGKDIFVRTDMAKPELAAPEKENGVQKGLRILALKPLCLSIAEGQELVALARREGARPHGGPPPFGWFRWFMAPGP